MTSPYPLHRPSLRVIIVLTAVILIIRVHQPAAQLHQRSGRKAIVTLGAELEPLFRDHRVEHFLGIRLGQALVLQRLGLLELSAMVVLVAWLRGLQTFQFCSRRPVEPEGLQGCDGHDLFAVGVVRLEHSVQDALDKVDLIWGVGRRELRSVIAGRVDQAVDTVGRGRVVVGLGDRAADLVVEGGNGAVDGAHVGDPVCFCDIVVEDFTTIFDRVSARAARNALDM